MKTLNQASARNLAKSKNWLLAKSRQWHRWGGLLAGLFTLVAATSGIVLNYKQPVFDALGLERRFPKEGAMPDDKPKRSESAFTTVTGFKAAATNVERLLEIARQEWGDVPLDRIELKEEHGELIYKIKRRGGDESWVNATRGSYFVKGGAKGFGYIGRFDPNAAKIEPLHHFTTDAQPKGGLVRLGDDLYFQTEKGSATTARRKGERANLAEPPPLKELGRKVGCSPFHLSRTFSSVMDLT